MQAWKFNTSGIMTVILSRLISASEIINEALLYIEKVLKKATKITITNFDKKDIYGRILAHVQIFRRKDKK